MKRWIPLIAAIVVVAGAAIGSTVKTWSTGEVINSTDLNGSFSHIHSTMVGGHGARLINSDVSAAAAIAHSKLATPGLLPRAWAIWKTACATGTTPCAPTIDVGVSDVVWNATGDYAVRLDVGRPNTSYIILVTAYSAAGADTVCGTYSHGTGTTLGSFGVKCYTAGAAADAAFQVVVLDDDGA